jgi:hypothetical protein
MPDDFISGPPGVVAARITDVFLLVVANCHWFVSLKRGDVYAFGKVVS